MGWRLPTARLARRPITTKTALPIATGQNRACCSWIPDRCAPGMTDVNMILRVRTFARWYYRLNPSCVRRWGRAIGSCVGLRNQAPNPRAPRLLGVWKLRAANMEMYKMFRQIARLAIAAMLFAAMAPAASAHTMLEQSWPRAGEAVAAAPASLRLRFSERIELVLARVTLISARRESVALGEPALEAGNRRTLVIPLAGPLMSGDYEVTWRVVSADGHPSEGRFRFSVAP